MKLWQCFPSPLAEFIARSSPFRICFLSLTLFRPHWNDRHAQAQPLARSSPRITLLILKHDNSKTISRMHKQKSKVFTVRKRAARRIDDGECDKGRRLPEESTSWAVLRLRDRDSTSNHAFALLELRGLHASVTFHSSQISPIEIFVFEWTGLRGKVAIGFWEFDSEGPITAS